MILHKVTSVFNKKERAIYKVTKSSPLFRSCHVIKFWSLGKEKKLKIVGFYKRNIECQEGVEPLILIYKLESENARYEIHVGLICHWIKTVENARSGGNTR